MPADPGLCRSTALAQAVSEIEAGLNRAWTALLDEFGIQPGSPDELALAWQVGTRPAPGQDTNCCFPTFSPAHCPPPARRKRRGRSSIS
jgi:hypothetical protein